MVQALDPRLTRTKPEPPAPPRQCRDDNGKATVCNRALPDQIDALRAWGRGMAAQLREIQALQPKEPPRGP